MDSAMAVAPTVDSAMVVSLVEEILTVVSAVVDLKSSTVDLLVVETVASAMVDPELSTEGSLVVEIVASAMVDLAMVDSSVVETVDSSVVETVDTATEVDSAMVDPELSTEDSLTAETASLQAVTDGKNKIQPMRI